MSAKSNAPIIIKRKKVVSGGGHHGGAWKVAYADFVTAMMAFFMLMWLLNATTEQQRKGLADYFSPTIPINRISGGGDGAFGGDSVFTEETLSQNGTGASAFAPTEGNLASGDTGVVQSEEEGDGEEIDQAETEETIGEALFGSGGESYTTENALRHVLTRVTDEGLIIEVFDLEHAPLFDEQSSAPSQVMVEIAEMLAEVFSLVSNEVAINGHIRSMPVILADNPAWDLSSARAGQARRLLEEAGLESLRIQRVTGFADRRPVARNSTSIRNNRLEIILLRSGM